MESNDLALKYLQLLRDYTDGRMSGSEFMHEYLSEFKDDDVTETPDDVYEILDSLFFACDSYSPDVDPEKIIGGIGEDQFFKEVAYARKDLEELLQERNGTNSDK